MAGAEANERREAALAGGRGHPSDRHAAAAAGGTVPGGRARPAVLAHASGDPVSETQMCVDIHGTCGAVGVRWYDMDGREMMSTRCEASDRTLFGADCGSKGEGCFEQNSRAGVASGDKTKMHYCILICCDGYAVLDESS